MFEFIFHCNLGKDVSTLKKNVTFSKLNTSLASCRLLAASCELRAAGCYLLAASHILTHTMLEAHTGGSFRILLGRSVHDEEESAGGHCRRPGGVKV